MSRAMTQSTVQSGVSRLLARFSRDHRGVSAVEFAMLLPLMVTLYLGSVEISLGVGIDRKVTLVARTVADLASQVSSINNSDMTNMLSASSAVIAPYDKPPYSATMLKVVVSAVSVSANGTATVAWSDTLNGTRRSVGSTVTLPTALNIANTQLIFSEVTFDYTPVIGYVITGTLTLSDKIYMRPRLSDTITRVNS
jgi:Flp pilus assembly protein TadG